MSGISPSLLHLIFVMRPYTDDGPVGVIAAVQFLVLLRFRFAAGRARQETEKDSKSAADAAPAIPAAGKDLR